MTYKTCGGLEWWLCRTARSSAHRVFCADLFLEAAFLLRLGSLGVCHVSQRGLPVSPSAQPRYAIYYAPPANSGLWDLAQHWLGRDCESGAALPRPNLEGPGCGSHRCRSPRRRHRQSTPLRFSCNIESTLPPCRRHVPAGPARCPGCLRGSAGLFRGAAFGGSCPRALPGACALRALREHAPACRCRGRSLRAPTRAA